MGSKIPSVTSSERIVVHEAPSEASSTTTD